MTERNEGKVVTNRDCIRELLLVIAAGAVSRDRTKGCDL